jgi:hypothetical protein
MDDEVKAALSKIEHLVTVLAGDVGSIGRKLSEHDQQFASQTRMLEQLVQSRADTDSALRAMAASQASLASAVGQALAQLTIAQSFEKRLERLEATVFPSKH